ncbi:hypothetical protein GGS23DRAFT_567507 [Durotheca rogersii]|uniref:uncharacterized protein n=1 Tax=Durotheca rogersii TaxID=419775 RepID=UPI00221EC520|nr:uncharacterized protein GGS23DRAFT_567507 [Durotheca rogersii]KAI5863542.1 hypothetical protein GGS23DRAFT_567507 [Durotheca rogersii]
MTPRGPMRLIHSRWDGQGKASSRRTSPNQGRGVNGLLTVHLASCHAALPCLFLFLLRPLLPFSVSFSPAFAFFLSFFFPAWKVYHFSCP